MKFWRRKEKAKVTNQQPDRNEVLNGLRSVSTYFERNIQSDEIFRPASECSQRINKILETKNPLSESNVIEIICLFNDIKKVERYDGTGWFDYGIRLCHFLRLNGFTAEFKGKEMRLTERL